MATEIDNVKNGASSFFEKMAGWERARLAQFPPDDDAQAEQLQALRKIYDEHLTAKAASRKQSRYELLSFGEPPDFEKRIAKVEPADEDSYWVYIPEGVTGNLRFHFVRESDGWKIDFKETEDSPGKWKKLLDI